MTEGNVKVMKILAGWSIALQLVCSILLLCSDISMAVLTSCFVFMCMISSLVDSVIFNDYRHTDNNYSLIWHLIMMVYYAILAICMIFAPPYGIVFVIIGCSFVIALSEALTLLLGKTIGIPFLPCGKDQNSSTVHPQEDEISNDLPPPYNECVIDQQLPGYYEVV